MLSKPTLETLLAETRFRQSRSSPGFFFERSLGNSASAGAHIFPAEVDNCHGPGPIHSGMEVYEGFISIYVFLQHVLIDDVLVEAGRVEAMVEFDGDIAFFEVPDFGGFVEGVKGVKLSVVEIGHSDRALKPAVNVLVNLP